MLNRSLLAVRVRQPFLDWLRNLPDPIDPEITLQVVNEDGSAYLLPSYDDEEERNELLRMGFDVIFEDQLASWWSDEADWPKRSLEVFFEWFEVEWHSMVEDLVDGPLVDE